MVVVLNQVLHHGAPDLNSFWEYDGWGPDWNGGRLSIYMWQCDVDHFTHHLYICLLGCTGDELAHVCKSVYWCVDACTCVGACVCA
jgi:hypothetical protein